MSSKHKTLQDLFHHQVKDLYYAERHAGKTLLKMAKAATAAALQRALEARHDQAAVQVERLDTIFEAMDKKAHGVPCEAMQGIIEETKTLLDDFDQGAVLDAGLIAAAQAIDHYAMARYTTLRLWAGQLGLSSAEPPIDATLAAARQSLDQWASLAGALPLADRADAGPMTLKEAALVGLA